MAKDMYAGYGGKNKGKKSGMKYEANMTLAGDMSTMPRGNASFGGAGLSSGKITKRSYMSDYK